MSFSSEQMAQMALISKVGGTVNSAVGSYYSADSQTSSLAYQSAMSRINAGVANTNADYITKVGNMNADAALAWGDANAAAISTVGDFNQRIAELAAQSSLAAGQQQIAAQTLKAGQVKGAQRAAMAANGIDLGEGSAAEVQVSTDMMKELDTNTLQANAVRTAWGYRAEGLNAQLQAQTQALNAKTSASMQALNLRNNAFIESTNARNSALGYSASSALQSAAASGISPSGAAATSLLGGVGTVADAWYDYTKVKGSEKDKS